MSNEIYTNGIFNEEVKNRFFNRYQEGTVDTVKRVFKRSAANEISLDKDLYDFTRDEIKKVLFALTPKTIKSSTSNGSLITTYLSWAIEQGYREGNINPLDGVDHDWYEQFIDKSRLPYYTEEDFDGIVNQLVNKQDQATFQLIFEGVGAETFDELFNLRKSDVNFETRELSLVDKYGRNRKITVSEKCINFIEGAIQQQEYIKNNGVFVGSRGSATMALVKADYVIKKTYRSNSDSDRGDYFLLNRRTSSLKDSLREPLFTPMAIRDSGMLKMARDFYVKDKELTNDHLTTICEQFGTNKVFMNGGERTNIYQYKRAFLNDKTLKEVYTDLE